MKKETYQDLYRQYLELKAQKGENYYLHCTGGLSDEQYRLFTIHMNCQMQHIENELEQASYALPAKRIKYPSLSKRLLSWLF